jgi:hypothetical protein
MKNCKHKCKKDHDKDSTKHCNVKDCKHDKQDKNCGLHEDNDDQTDDDGASGTPADGTLLDGIGIDQVHGVATPLPINQVL